MQTSHDRFLFLTSAILSGLATIALASAATSTVSVDAPAYLKRAHNWSDAFCAPDTCTRVAKTRPGGPPSVLY